MVLLASLLTSRSPTSPFAFLLAYKSAAKPPPRSALVKKMASDAEVARFIAELLPTAVKCIAFYIPLVDSSYSSTSGRFLLPPHAPNFQCGHDARLHLHCTKIRRWHARVCLTCATDTPTSPIQRCKHSCQSYLFRPIRKS